MTSLLQEKYRRRVAQRAQHASLQTAELPNARGAPFVCDGDDERLFAALSSNATTLRCLRVSGRLLHDIATAPTTSSSGQTNAATQGLITRLGDALSANTTVRSLEITPEAYVTLHAMASINARNTLPAASTSAALLPPREDHEAQRDDDSAGYVAWTNLLLACYNLPLRSLQLGGLGLAPAEVEQALRLVAHLSGTVRGTGRARPASLLSPSPTQTTFVEGTIEFLDLSGNRLTPTAASLLHDILYHPNCSLKRVCLNECQLGDAGAARLFCSVDRIVSEEATGSVSVTTKTTDGQRTAKHAKSSATTGVRTCLSPRLEWLELRWNGLTTQCEADVQLAYVTARALTAPPRTIPMDASASERGTDASTSPKYARTVPLVLCVSEGNHFSTPAHKLLSAPANNDQNRRRASREAGLSQSSMTAVSHATTAAGAARRTRPRVGHPSRPPSARAGLADTQRNHINGALVSPVESGTSLPPASARTDVHSASSSASSGRAVGTGGSAGVAAGAGPSAVDDRMWWCRDFVSKAPLRQRIRSSSTWAQVEKRAHFRGKDVSCVSGVTSIGAMDVTPAHPSVPPSIRSPSGVYNASAGTRMSVVGADQAHTHPMSFALALMVRAVDQVWCSRRAGASAAATKGRNPRSAVAVASSGGLGLTSDAKRALRRARRAHTRSTQTGTQKGAATDSQSCHCDARNADNGEEDDDKDDADDADTRLCSDDKSLSAVVRLLSTGTGPAPPPACLARFPALHMTADLLQRRAYWHTYFRSKQQRIAHAQKKRDLERQHAAETARRAREEVERQTSQAALARGRAVVLLAEALGPGCDSTSSHRHDPYASLRLVASLLKREWSA